MLLLAFALARLVVFGVGVRFDIRSLSYGWHMLDVPQLRDNLLQSLWYLHATPPGFQLFCGVILKAAPGYEEWAFGIIFMGFGLALAFGLRALLRRLGLGPWLASTLAGVFAVSPAALLYENWLFYAYPVTALLVVAAVGWYDWISEGRSFSAWLAFGCLTSIALTMAFFHLVWLLALGIFGVAAARHAGSSWRAGALAWLVCTGLVVAWYTKNALLFGVFGASSWLGMNVAKVTVFQIPPAPRAAYVAAGKLPSIALVPVFQPVETYRGHYTPLPPTGVSALDVTMKSTGTINFNHRDFVPIAKAYMPADRAAVRLEPLRYLKAVVVAHLIYFEPATDYVFLSDNLWILRHYRNAAEVIGNGCFASLLPRDPAPRELTFRAADMPAYMARVLPSLAWWLVIGTPLLIFWGLRQASREGRSPHRIARARAATLLFLVFNIAFVAMLGNWLEQGENNRFRFSTDPLLLALAGAWLAAWRSGQGQVTGLDGDHQDR
jgi:hypothetical protein